MDSATEYLIAAVIEAHESAWGESLRALVLYGSALRGDYIPNCSDMDFRLILGLAAFGEAGALDIERVLAAAAPLRGLSPAPFRYIQVYPVSAADDAECILIPGTYAVVAGSAAISHPTPEAMLEAARQDIAALPEKIAYHSRHLLQHGEQRFDRALRLLCTDVWPALRNFVALQTADPYRAWQASKQEAMIMLGDDELRNEAVRFLRGVTEYYSAAEPGLEAEFALIRQAVGILRWVHELRV